MDNKTQLIPFLKGLGNELEDKFYNINLGGCCVIADLIGEHLQNFTDTKVVVFNGWSGTIDLDEVRKDIEATMGDPNDKNLWDAEGCGFGHVLLEIESDGTFYLVDSEGVHDSLSYSEFSNRDDGYLTLDEARNMGNQVEGWNDSFDRRQIPQIRETIDNAFEKFAREVSA